jgi:hypothetical protein
MDTLYKDIIIYICNDLYDHHKLNFLSTTNTFHKYIQKNTIDIPLSVTHLTLSGNVTHLILIKGYTGKNKNYLDNVNWSSMPLYIKSITIGDVIFKR